MTESGSLHVRAGEFHDALAFAVPAKKRRVALKRPIVVSLTYDSDARLLTISDALYGERRQLIPALGIWPGRVQVNGEIFRRMLSKFPPATDIALMPTKDALVVLTAQSRLVAPRTDRNGVGVDERPLPPSRQHRGKTIVPPDPTTKRVELADTWRFSARVPMPQHRESKKRS